MDAYTRTIRRWEHRSLGDTVLLLFLSICAFATSLIAQDNLFSSPTHSKKPTAGYYPTSASLLAATKNGEIPEMVLRENEATMAYSLGPAVMTILQKEYGLDRNNLYGGVPEQMFGFLIISVTKYEMNNHDQRNLQAFQKNQDRLFGTVDDRNHNFTASREAFRKFAIEYSKAVTEYATSKQKNEEQEKAVIAQQQAVAVQQQVAVAKQQAEMQRKAEEADRKAKEEARQEKELSDARSSSLQAQRDIQASAAEAAIQKQRDLRAQKMKDCLVSPEYKLWEASLQVQQGEQMISDAQKVLDHEGEVEKESGVINLTTRRAAGERVVAGRDLVEHAFGKYRKLGGKATTPEAVDPGPDPAAEYR